jgi:hypothetical protein
MTEQKTIAIACKLKRAGGSKIDLHGKIYHFKPTDPANPEAPHVCAVPFEDAAAIHRLLQIREGYELVDSDAELPPKPAPDKGQTIHAAKAGAGEASKPEGAPVIIKNAAGDEINLSVMERPELAQLAKDEFGITPHHKWPPTTIIAKILEAMRGED